MNNEQKKAVQHPEGPLLIAAGAGSGKTRALTERLKILITRGTRPEKIVAITFTNKAAKEMRERIFGKEKAALRWSPVFPVPGEPFIGTFHSLGAKILREEIVRFSPRNNRFSIFDNDDSLRIVKKICKTMDLDGDYYNPRVVYKRISAMKGELLSPESLFNSHDERDFVLAEIYKKYESDLVSHNAFDFDDLLEKVVSLLQTDSEVLNKYQNLFDQVLVDEYQDINTVQYQMVRLLAGKHKNVTVVGDDAQAIYAFRGADFRNFLNFTRDWPKATLIKLEQNYRSTKNIIDAASAVIGHNKVQTPKKLWTENDAGERISVVVAEDDDTESVWVANEVRSIYTKNPGAEIAVIYRTNAQSRAMEQALISENLAYKIFGGLRFYDRKEIKDIVSALTFFLNPKDLMSKERLEKSLGKRRGADFFTRLAEMSDLAKPVEIINLFLESTHYKNYLETKFENWSERMENIAELIKFATEFESLPELIERISLLNATDVSQHDGALLEEGEGVLSSRKKPVQMMTIHMAKGLEFDYVFLVGCNEGLLPHEKSMSQESEVEEERRLMYVAMTRARVKLYILFHIFPSRFLKEIPEDLVEVLSPRGGLAILPDEDDMYIEY